MEGMDELLDRELTKEYREDARKAAEDLLLPPGNYTTKGGLSLTTSKSDRENTLGRLEYRFFGQVESETGARGGIGFTISPDRFNDRLGRPDARWQLFQAASKAYTLAFGREAARASEVAEYVRDYPVTLRVTRLPATESFDASNQVRNIMQAR